MKTAASMKSALLMFLAVLAAPAWAQQACPACHGAQGEGNAQMKAPRIAGLGEGYILRQLDAYANGARQNPLMTPVAQQLTPDQRRAMALAYANTPPAKATKTSSAPAASSPAAKLATVGDAAKGVQACANCHGPEGIGQPPTIPSLAGQQQAYLVDTLRAWKSGARKTDPSGQMNLIGSKLSDADIAGLARYYSSLPPPSPQVLVSKGPAQAPAATGNSQGGNNALQGTGATQGASTTESPQGAGGGSNDGKPR
jgi:cytochrome c553